MARDADPGFLRRVVHAEVERLASEMRVHQLDDALEALAGGDGLPAGLEAEVLFAGGVPRIRPVLVLLASRAGGRGEDPAAAAEVAYTAELLQAAIRLHDAALGQPGGLRRRAARRVVGRAAHFLGGNHVMLRALEIARRAPAPEILGDALDALRVVAEGHALGEDLRARAATPAEARTLAEDHTGAVLSFACRAGGRLGGLGPAELLALGGYGRHLGVGIHVAEDVQAVERGEVIPSRATLFPIAAASEVDPTVHDLWSRARRGNADLAELARRVREAGGLHAAREAMVKESWAARKALQGVPASAEREALERIAGSLGRAA